MRCLTGFSDLSRSTRAAVALAVGSLLCAMPGLAGAAPHYLRSDFAPPWGVSENETQMDVVFGVGNWADERYESVDVSRLFAEPDFIFMEGGDHNADELESFLEANEVAIADFVSAGGVLFVNAAPTEGDGMNLGFGVSLSGVDRFCASDCNALDPMHPIFLGPFAPVGTSLSGNFFSHGTLSGPATPLIASAQTGDVALAELRVGRGLVLFGAMSTVNFHSEPEGRNLRSNLLAYAVRRVRRQVNFTLEPMAGESPTSVNLTMIAHATGRFGPLEGLTVRFEISGANPAFLSTRSGPDGSASFSYTGVNAGTDVILACVDEDVDGLCGEEEPRITATRVWKEDPGPVACRVAYKGFLQAASGRGARVSGAARVGAGRARSGHLYRELGPRSGVGLVSFSTESVRCLGRSATLEGRARTARGEVVTYRIEVQDIPGFSRDRYRIRLSNGYDSGLQPLLDGGVEVRAASGPVSGRER